MGRRVRRGPGPSSVLITPDHAGNVVGIDPHKQTLSAAIVDPRGQVVAVEHFRVSHDGHRALCAWARQYGQIKRWGVEGAASWGRHTAVYLARQDYDVRDVCPHRTNRRDRARQRGKSDTLDCERVARETLAHPLLPRPFKRAAGDRGPDEQAELLALRHRARQSLLASRQHLLNEAEALLAELPLELRDRLPDSREVRPRLRALARHGVPADADAPTVLRIEMLVDYYDRVRALDTRERALVATLAELVQASGSTLDELCGLSTRSIDEILVEVGDPRRFTAPGFACFDGTAPIPASTGDAGEPVRHRLNRGGNRRLNAVLHTMAVTQLRREPRARAIYDGARARGHTKKEAMRILKRHLSDVVYRRMIRDLKTQQTAAEPEAPDPIIVSPGQVPCPPDQPNQRSEAELSTGSPTGPSAASRNAVPLTARRSEATPAPPHTAARTPKER
jgi:transposase